jgi:hypothetical protein
MSLEHQTSSGPTSNPVDAATTVVAVANTALQRDAGVAQWQSSSFPS